MANEKVNKVVLGNETLIDLTPDTVTASKLALGETAHDASGEQITGTMVGGASELADLDDVNLTSLSNGQIIKYNSTADEWQNANETITGVKGDSESTYRTGNVNITKANIGLGNVPNVTTNNQTPTFSQASTRANIDSGETLAVLFGKIKKFFADLKTVAFSGLVDDLTDVSITDASDGQILKYNGTSQEWENGKLPLANKNTTGIVKLGDGLNAPTYVDTYYEEVLSSGSSSPNINLNDIPVSEVPVIRIITDIETGQFKGIGNVVVSMTGGYAYLDFSSNLVSEVTINPATIQTLQYGTQWNSIVVGLWGFDVGDTIKVVGYSSTTEFTDDVSVSYNAISTLNDVNISNISDGQGLIYDGTSSKFVNRTITVNPSASQVSYSNTSSGLVATDVQSAIDELASSSPSGEHYSNTVSCAVGDTYAIFTDVSYSATATYEVYGDNGIGTGIGISAIVEAGNPAKVGVIFANPLKNATTVYLKYWER